MRKLKIYIAFSILILIFYVAPLHSQKGDLLQCHDLYVTVSDDIDFGVIARGTGKQIYGILKFTIVGPKNSKVCLKKYSFNGTANEVLITTEWKMGQNTGFESNFKNTQVQLKNGDYYVTVTAKYISASPTAKLGVHKFEQVLTVEFDY